MQRLHWACNFRYAACDLGAQPFFRRSELALQKLFLGVDGGGTKCRMRLASESLEPLAEAVVAAPSNLQVRNGDAAYSAVNDLIAEVFDKAGLDPEQDGKRTYACFGMAGGRMKSARESFVRREFPLARLSVFDDIDIARAGAHEGEDGAVLNIGTGSAGLGVMNGERHQVGGWGFLVGDTMAGAILGRELLRKALRAHEHLEPGSPLTEAVMAEFDNDGDTMMSWSFNNPDAYAEMEELHKDGLSPAPSGPVPARPADYGRFVPLFFEYYDKGDPVAAELMAFELQAVDQYVHWFMARGAKAIAIVGGFGERLFDILVDRYGDVIVRPKSAPLQGAVILAKQLFGDA